MLRRIQIRWSVNNQYLGQVGRYFHDAFYGIWGGGLGERVKQLLKDCPDCKIWVTGHSLGGAMASIAASYLAYSGVAKGHDIKLVTFGQPKTGDTNFGNNLTKKVPYSYRVVNNRDLVVQVPQWYDHHSKEPTK
ncbi:unnamed protein product [Strongylus vulgaris]|uniref:Fungal lipase-type domain-containing protein n=1 Tax=Strongylus vulgaris TaxID=40348 RepID=A0A3P7JQP2_STRVU|nr:unnamed protein product [Strongylus vulgaris]